MLSRLAPHAFSAAVFATWLLALAQPNKVGEQRGAGLVSRDELLWMPLHAQGMTSGALQPLDDAVGRLGHDAQSARRTTRRLMVHAIHRHGSPALPKPRAVPRCEPSTMATL